VGNLLDFIIIIIIRGEVIPKCLDVKYLTEMDFNMYITFH